MVHRGGHLLRPRRGEQELLHPGVVQRGERHPLPERRRGGVHRRHAGGGTLQPPGEGPRRRGPRFRCRRALRPRGGERHPAQLPLPESRRRAVRGRRRAFRHRVRGERGRPGRHGDRRLRLRRRRHARPRHRELLERDGLALPQRGRRLLHRPGAGLGDRPQQSPHPRVRGLLLRLRPRRTPGHLRRERARRKRHRRRPAAGQLPPGPPSLPEPGRRRLRRGNHRLPGSRTTHGGPGSGLRRHRRGRRSGPRGQRERRPGAPLPQRRRRAERLGGLPAPRRKFEPGRNRCEDHRCHRGCRHDPQRDPRREERHRVRLAEPARGGLRSRLRGRAVSAAVLWPSGARSEVEAPAARRIHIVEEPPS